MRKYVGVLLMVCLIASSAFATNSWNAATGSWGTAGNWSAGVVPDGAEQVKINGGTTCTLDVDAGSFVTNKVTVGTNATEGVLNVVSGGSLTSVLEIQVGDALKNGRITQTGGTINLAGTSSKDSKLEVGYKTGVGYYTISGGSIVGDPDYSQLQVGASGASGGTGTFTVVGTGGSVSVRYLFVGASTSSGQYIGTGTLAFEIDGGVSAINAESVYIDPTVEAVANLSVTKTGALPAGDIILINNTGADDVNGAFDNVAWGSTITLGGVDYTLTNTYIGGLDGIANDVALIAPDTFTLTYTAGANGSIIGTTPQTVNYGADGTAVTAQPALGYHFVKWSDNSTQNPRTDLNVTANITVQASFATSLVPAFPGAEGSGGWATGGRGGDVYEVTNLTNAGPGSIVDALSVGNRTIVFKVSGTIELDGVMLEPQSNTTIAGQTAPGDGICIKGRIHILGGVHDIIIRYIRIRVDEGAANSSGDAIDIDNGSNIIIDHVSTSYARDETISCQENSDYVTVQWCIMSEALTFETHGYGSLIRGAYGQQKTYHHNLYAHNNGRNPRPGNYTDTSSDPEGLYFDFRNNVVYNWAGGHPGYNADTSSTSRYNFVGNVFIRGAESSGDKAFKEDSVSSYAYWSGNAHGASYGTVAIPSDQWSLVTFNGFSTAQIDAYKARSYLIPMEAVTTTSASQALTDVLAVAGTSFPSRDLVDARIVNDVINGTGSSIANTSSSSWPVLNSLPAPADTDHDGMPDSWETANGLNINNPADRNNYNLNANYTNLEVYLYSLVTFTLTYTAGANGSIIGTTPQTVNHGANGTAVTAQPALGYHFFKWSDDSTQNPRTDINVTADIAVTAIFVADVIDTSTLTYTAGANGSIIGTTPQAVYYGADGTAVTAQPALGYHFVKWSDDSTQNPRTDLNVTADITVQAIFATDIIMITSKCKVTAGKTQYTGDSDFNDMKDSFTASGTMSFVPSDLNTIDHIDVSIISADGNIIFFESNDFNYARNVTNDKFTHTYKIPKGNPTGGAITSLVIDFSKKTFAVTVSSADLTGLACPLQLIISLGDFVLGGDVNETIVNGKNKTIPTRLMRLYHDKLVVTKAKAKNSTKK